jgi:ParB-like chromosome segregation protein Spo0J
MRPVALEIGAGNFALAAGHRRIAISLLAGTLKAAAD